LARDLATQGADAFDRGDFALALDRFSRAASMLDVPTITLMEGRTLVRLGRWTEALDRFHRTAHATLAPDAPAAFQAALGEAAAEAAHLEKVMPRLNIAASSETAEAQDVVITLDKNPIHKLMLNIARPLDPGSHVVAASANGVEYFASTVDVHPEEVLQVTVPLAVQPKPAAVVAAPPPQQGPPLTPHHDPAALPAWLLPVGIGATALGGAGAIASGILAAGHQAKLKRACKPANGSYDCPFEARDEVNGLELQRGVFIVSAAIGAIGAGLTTYLLATDATSPQVALKVSLTGANLTGTF
jgi:hypothetical protein